MPIDELARKLKVSPETIAEWESGTAQPNHTALEKVATICKRSLAALLLSEPPVEPAVPPDLRTLPEKERHPLSGETLLAIRRTRHLQSAALDLMREMGIETAAVVGRASADADAEALAVRERQRLGISLDAQLQLNSNDEAFRVWRSSLENINVLVFRMSFPVEEARGFTLPGKSLPAIVVNGSDAIQARIFTLLHEYCHLLRDTGGICLPKEAATDGEQAQEVFCNHFAGAFLVPTDALNQESAKKTVEQLASRFRVSRHVVLRRMLISNLISAREYQSTVAKWAKQAEENAPKKSEGFELPPDKCLREHGRRFVSLVVEAKRQKLITYSDVSELLGIRLKHLGKVQALLGG